MRRLVWVLGLGLIGLFFFGSVGGTIGGALGYAIGSMTISPLPAKTEPSASPPVQSAADEQDQESHETFALRMLLLIILLGGGFIFVREFVWKDDSFPVPPAPVITEEPPTITDEATRVEVLPSASVWSTTSCLQQFFGQAIGAGIAVPPEVTFFCAYPWNTKALAVLLKRLEDLGVTPITALEHLNNPLADIAVTIEMKKKILEMPMPPEVRQAYELFHILPNVWSAHPSRPDHLKLMDEVFDPAFIKTLTEASKSIDWSAPATDSTLIRQHDFDSEGASIRLFTSETVAVSLNEMVEVMITIVGGETLKAALDQRFPGDGNALRSILQDLFSQGLHAKHMLPLYLIEGYTHMLHSEAQKARSDEQLIADFRPVDRQQQRQHTPLEIYWLKNAPASWCGGSAVMEAGQYCEGEDRVYARVAATAAAGPGAIKGMFDSVGAVLLHELAHAYYNPQKSDTYPFVVEGIVTALGERAMRAMLAAVSYMPSVKGDMNFYQNAKGEMGLTVKTGSGPAKTIDVETLSKKQIATTAYTPYAEKAMCSLLSKPLDEKVLKAYLTMSNGTFRSQPVDHLNMAYTYGWGVFNFGLDAAKLGASVSQTQRDAGIVQRAAVTLKQNHPLTPEMETQLADFTVGVNKLLKKEVAERSIKCQKS